MEPLYQEIDYQHMLSYWYHLQHLEPSVFLDGQPSPLAQYSYIALSPFAVFKVEGQQCLWQQQPIDESCAFTALRSCLKRFKITPIDDLPPFQGGACGLLSYDLGRHIETLPNIAQTDRDYDDMHLGFYDLILSFDHSKQRAWALSSGLPEQQPSARRARAQYRLKQLLDDLRAIPATWAPLALPAIPLSHIKSHDSASQYQQKVQQVIDYILAGDIFQANLSQRFECLLPNHWSPKDLYCRLRATNPAPFSAYANLGSTIIASSSPERFIQAQGNLLTTSPIKGTCRRAQNQQEDQKLKYNLQNNPKERAENTMIVDLMRNDLSKVCQPHSIEVPQLCGLESFATVHHLVSKVTGKLAADQDIVDLLQATLPGGSITGAPKIRAMEIIDSLEPYRRGPYCGNLCYIGFDGCFDSNILIRTMVMQDNWLSFNVGGAVVLGSSPQHEYHETLIKAQALLTTLTHNETTVASWIKHHQQPDDTKAEPGPDTLPSFKTSMQP